MTNLTLEALQVLDAIERKGSFARAAMSLNKVPSAVSYTVQKLEQDLGITLFQRQGRRSILTAAGQHLVQQGRQLLDAAEQLAASTQQVATGWEPRLRIALDHIISGDTLFPLIDQLYAKQPGIDIELSQEVLAGTWEALIEDRVDLIVGAIDEQPSHRGIRSVPWQSLRMILVAAPNHPACQHQKPLSDDDIRSYRSVVIRDSSKNLPPLSRGILNQTSIMYVPSMALKIQAHCAGIGVGLVPEMLARPALAAGRLQTLALQQPRLPTTLKIAWKITNRGQARQWLVEQLQQLELNS